MTTLPEARFRIEQTLIERQAAGLPAQIEDVEVVVCETSTPKHVDCLAFVYLVDADPDDLLYVGFEVPCPPRLFDRRRAEQELLRPHGEAVH